MTSTEIANLALSHIGVGTEIANLDSEDSQEAAACRRFYSLALNAMLRDYDWNFARKIAALELVEADPNDEWGYSYQYPSDCLDLKRVLSGIRNDSRDTRAPFKIVQDASGSVILCDLADATGEYIATVTNSNFLPTDFCNALAFRIAAYIAPRLTGGDPFKMGERALQMYQIEASRAYVNSKNEEQPDQVPDAEMVRIRDGSANLDQSELRTLL